MSAPTPWGARRQGEPTSAYLGRALDWLQLPEMAQRARAKHFDDYFCPPDVDDGMNINRLVGELGTHYRTATAPDWRRRCRMVIDAAKTGEFDGTTAESEAWQRSPEGQRVFNDLVEGR